MGEGPEALTAPDSPLFQPALTPPESICPEKGKTYFSALCPGVLGECRALIKTYANLLTGAEAAWRDC